MYSHFFNCDWGTTNFRLRLVDVASRQIVAESASSDGVATLARASTPAKRPNRFQSILQRHVAELSQKNKIDVDRAPVIISGMASSSMGWRDLPYAKTPMAIDGRELVLSPLLDIHELTQPVYLISGLQSDNDVMRGEETELVGLASLRRECMARCASNWILLPGTHCKHALVQEGRIVEFRTYMTGELFHLLCEQSSLKPSPPHDEQGMDWSQAEVVDAFCQGVRIAKESGLTSSLFQVRVRQLMNNLSGSASKALLSGQLIGSEIWSLERQSAADSQVILCADRKLNLPYRMALEIAGMSQRTLEIAVEEVERLSAIGQWQAFMSCRPITETHGQESHRPVSRSMVTSTKTNLH